MSVTVTAYRIVRECTSAALESAVNDMCAQGYEPTGAPYPNLDAGQWCQAMIKRTPEAEAGEIRLREPKRK
jgi:hypothetical protein